MGTVTKRRVELEMSNSFNQVVVTKKGKASKRTKELLKQQLPSLLLASTISCLFVVDSLHSVGSAKGEMAQLL